ncbi:MAG: efflux RND transporter permease subunit [Clostridiales bacterium]|nr:efflux RND transporter permease subunit [Clostridiales bacterium]
MLIKVVSAAIRNRKIVFALSIGLMIFGLFNYYIIPKQEDPDITSPFAMITTVYPGASPEIIEKTVTKKIEDKLVEIEGYDYSQSFSKNSVSIVILRLRNDADPDKSWESLRQSMKDLQSELPEECDDIEINTKLADTAGMIISLSGSEYSYEQLEFFAEDLKKDLMKIDGISRFDIDGVQKKEVKIEVEPQVLNQYQLSLSDIVNIIKANNVEIPAGTIEGESIINVKVSSRYENIEDIKDTIFYISSETGGSVRLKDIANIYMGLEEANYKVKYNGENSVLLTGYFISNKNIVIIGKAVVKKLDAFKNRLPSDVSMDKIIFQPHEVNKSTNNFILNLLQGVVFVVIVVFLGMGLRNALIVSAVIPLSICITFIMMSIFKIKLHQISISALIIALGMLVDNAIVTSDAIQVRIDRGDEKLRACIGGVREVAIPIFTSTLTTVAAFIPLLMLDSVAGEYVFSVPAIVIIALSASYFAALFVTPALAYISFKPSNDKTKKHRMRIFFGKLLDMGLRKKSITIAITLIIFGTSIYTALNLGLQFFPYADKDLLYININAEQNFDIEKTEKLTEEVFEILSKEEGVVFHTGAIGDGLPKFYNAVPLSTPSKDYAQVLFKVDLKKSKTFKNNAQFANHLQQLIDSQITGGTATVKLLELAEPTGAPVRIRISGEDMENLIEAAETIKASLREISGTINIEDDHNDKIYQYNVKMDTQKAAFYGLLPYDVQNEINIALMGRDASKLRQRNNEYTIKVKGAIENKEDLENLMIKSGVTDQKTLLKSFGEVKLDNEYPMITKYNRDMTVTVYSDVISGYNPVDITWKLERNLKKADLSKVEVVFDGEREKILEYFGDLGVSAIFAIFAAYLILLFQFGSFMQPLIILVTIPLSIIGSVFGIAIFKQPLSFTALLGIVSLAGIVVNNAILLIDFIDEERKKGKDIVGACTDAVEKRFRPIMLTTITTVIGLIPLALGGSSLMVPMAISLMSGLMVSTLLTLVIIPVVYAVFQKDNKDVGAKATETM